MSTDWRARAACARHDPERWFPKSTGKGALAEARQAQTICETCPVIAECNAYAEANQIPCGVWGGKLRSSGQQGAQRYQMPPRHGTNAAYARHLKRGETPCNDCREAHSFHHRQWVANAGRKS